MWRVPWCLLGNIHIRLEQIPMYAVMVAYVKIFGLTLWGCKFIIYIDAVPLVSIGNCKLKPANSGEISFTYISPVAISNTIVIKSYRELKVLNENT